MVVRALEAQPDMEVLVSRLIPYRFSFFFVCSSLVCKVLGPALAKHEFIACCRNRVGGFIFNIYFLTAIGISNFKNGLNFR